MNCAFGSFRLNPNTATALPEGGKPSNPTLRNIRLGQQFVNDGSLKIERVDISTTAVTTEFIVSAHNIQ
jgi:hypothetical protein